jgi:hypothetical protein
VEDVAEAVARILQAPMAHSVYELAGPQVYTYRELLRTTAAQAGREPLLVPFPFPLWRVIGFASELLPHPPITADPVDLMELDNVAAPDMPGSSSDPKAVEEMALGMAKTALYDAMREEGVGRAELARRLRYHLPEVSRLLDLLYASAWSTSKRLSQRSDVGPCSSSITTTSEPFSRGFQNLVLCDFRYSCAWQSKHKM